MKCRFVTVLALISASLALSAPAGAVELHWAVPVQVSAPGGGSAPPSLAVNDAGRAVVVWGGGFFPGTPVVVAGRAGAGAAWSAPNDLSGACSPACSRGNPVVAMNDAGTAAAIWNETTTSLPATTVLQVAVRPGGGESWRAPHALQSGPLASGFSGPAFDVSVDGSGAVIAAWLGADGTVMTARRSADGDWGDPERLAGPGTPASALGLSAGARGDAVATWIADCRPAAALRPTGGPWQAPRALDVDEACGENPAAAVDDAGNAVAAWRRWTGTQRVLRVRDLPAAGGPMGAVSDLGIAGAAGTLVNPPPITVTRLGAIALWRDDADTVRLAVRPPGGGWSPAEAAPGLGRSLGDVAGAVGPDGTVALFQASFTSFPRAVVRDPAGAWSAPARLTAAPSAAAGNPVVYAGASLALDGSDAVVASVDPARRSIDVTELTTRDGPRFDPGPAPAITGLTGPATVPAGALARLQVFLDRPFEDLAVAVERRDGSRWIVVSRARITGSAAVATGLAVRLARPGRTMLRVSVGGAVGAPQTSRPVAVNVTRPGRARLRAGPAPGAVVVGEGALWVLGQDAGEATVRRIDANSGRQVGPVLRVGGEARAIAAGAGAVWAVQGRGESSTLVRIRPSGGIGASDPIPGRVGSVAAGGAGVWIGGVCLPQRTPFASSGCDRRGAARVDSASGALTADRAVGKDGHADTVRIFGRRLWAWGEMIGNYDDTVLARADAATGRVMASISFSGRFGVPLLPVSATAVWRVDRHSIGTAYPGAGRTLYSTRQYRRLTAVPAGRLVWVLERRAITKVLATSRLLALDARTGARVGPFIELGQSELQGEGLAVTRGAVWVLRPAEGTLIRVPIPPALR